MYMTLDLNKLKEIADNVESEQFMWDDNSASELLYEAGNPDTEKFIKTFNPAVVKEMIARIEELERQFTKLTYPPSHQDNLKITMSFKGFHVAREICRPMMESGDFIAMHSMNAWASLRFEVDENELPKV